MVLAKVDQWRNPAFWSGLGEKVQLLLP